MADRLKAVDKVENPAAHFDKPKKVVQDKALSHDEKKKALNTWEQDERQLLTASNEGMPESDEGLQLEDDNRLGEVVKAKAKIGEKPKRKSSHWCAEQDILYVQMMFLPQRQRYQQEAPSKRGC